MTAPPSNRLTARRRAAMQRASRSGTGFTLIEMVVVTAILAMMAALIVPNLVAIHESQLVRQAQAALLRLPSEAHNEAVRSGQPVILRVNGDAIVMERWNESDTDADPQNPQEVQEVKSVSLGNVLQVDGARLNGNTTDTGSWRWITYPDGSAFSAGLTFRIGSNTGDRSLWIPANGGTPTWQNGELPDTSTDTWPAGELQQRTQSS